MGLDNDTRGWIMTCISGVACIIGASVICIDVVVRQFPGMRDFKISESDAFLSASLSLSFGVMLFSSLYSMLPQSNSYLQDGGYSPREAIVSVNCGLFLAGVLGIRVLSSVLHRFMPTHVVDCDHTHDEEAGGTPEEDMAEHSHDDAHTVGLPKNGHGYGELEDEQTPFTQIRHKERPFEIETGVHQSYDRDYTNIRNWLQPLLLRRKGHL